MSEERMKILEMVRDGRIDASQATALLAQLSDETQMSEEQMKILEMLNDGKIDGQEAVGLLGALSVEDTRRRGHRGGWDFGFDKMGKMFDKLSGMKVFAGSARFQEATDVKGPLTIGGRAEFFKDVKVTGPVTAGGRAEFHGQAEHSGPIKCGGRLAFRAPAHIEAESIKVGGSLRFADKADVSVKENIEVKRDLVLERGAHLSISGDLIVDGEVIDKRKLGVEELVEPAAAANKSKDEEA